MTLAQLYFFVIFTGFQQVPDAEMLNHLKNPTWLTIILLFIIWFRPQIQAAIQGKIGSLTSTDAHRRDIEETKLDAELQDDVALWSSMVRLQTQTIEQNKILLDVIINSLEGQLKEIAVTVKTELSEIEKRWLAVTKELVQTKNELQILRMEVARMSDSYSTLEKHISILVRSYKNGGMIDDRNMGEEKA